MRAFGGIRLLVQEVELWVGRAFSAISAKTWIDETGGRVVCRPSFPGGRLFGELAGWEFMDDAIEGS